MILLGLCEGVRTEAISNLRSPRSLSFARDDYRGVLIKTLSGPALSARGRRN